MKILFYLFLTSLAFGQANCPQDTTGYEVVRDLTICYTKVNYSVEYHLECNCYYYEYTIISPEANKGLIHYIDFKFETSKEYSPLDRTLPYNPNCDRLPKLGTIPGEVNNLIPISIVSCPDGWRSYKPAVGIHENYITGGIAPNQSGTFKIASKFPPGRRKIKIIPEYLDLEEYLITVVHANEYEWAPGQADPPIALGEFYSWDLEVIGPVDPEELELFNGGGQKPDDVNLFLRYANPKESQTELPAGQNTFEILIYYGKTIKKETFKATLNDQDIKNLFSPVPGGGDYVKLTLQNGRNVLEFSIDGLNKRGHTANDKDRLVLIVK